MTIAITEDSWLSSIFGYPAFKIACNATDPSQLSEITSNVREHAGLQKEAFYYAKIAVSDVSVMRSLNAAGMFVVDVNVVLELDLNEPGTAAAISEQVAVSEVEPRHHDAVLNIAATGFVFSRFHLDPLVDNSVANRIKRCWIESYLQGRRGENLLVAIIGKTPVGFLAVLSDAKEKERSITIDLIAVDSAHRRKGVAEALIRHLAGDSRRDCRSLLVGTQAANIPSIRLYEKLGFRFANAQYVLHKHI